MPSIRLHPAQHAGHAEQRKRGFGVWHGKEYAGRVHAEEHGRQRCVVVIPQDVGAQAARELLTAHTIVAGYNVHKCNGGARMCIIPVQHTRSGACQENVEDCTGGTERPALEVKRKGAAAEQCWVTCGWVGPNVCTG